LRGWIEYCARIVHRTAWFISILPSRSHCKCIHHVRGGLSMCGRIKRTYSMRQWNILPCGIVDCGRMHPGLVLRLTRHANQLLVGHLLSVIVDGRRSMRGRLILCLARIAESVRARRLLDCIVDCADRVPNLVLLPGRWPDGATAVSTGLHLQCDRPLGRVWGLYGWILLSGRSFLDRLFARLVLPVQLVCRRPLHARSHVPDRAALLSAGVPGRHSLRRQRRDGGRRVSSRVVLRGGQPRGGALHARVLLRLDGFVDRVGRL
jgi:hypothetical protein